jgi:predicted alpha/beta-fold hydrolase
MQVTPYLPPRWLKNGHRMTVYTWARPRRFPSLPPSETRVFEVGRDARVTARCHWLPDRRARPTLVLLHGLEGSADAHYMRGMADKACAAGINVVRLNQRNCGGSDHLSLGVYHSGLTADPAAVIRELVDGDGLRAVAVAGYSLGGNLALKLAGEFGATPPSEVCAFGAVSPTLDLPACIAALERPSNWMYQQNFLVALKRRIRRKRQLFPHAYSTAALRGIRTVRQFDDAYTAPMSGFRDAADYYDRASSLRVAHLIQVPTLVITAGDDPFVPVAPFRDPAVAGNPAIRLIVTPHGGHCGFLARRSNGSDPRGTRNGCDDGYWAESTVVRFVRETVGRQLA